MKPLAPRLHAAPRWLFWLLLLSGALLLGLCILFPVLGVLEWVAAVPSGLAILTAARDRSIRLRRMYGYGFCFFGCFYLVNFHWFLYMYPLTFAGLSDAASAVVVIVAWFGLSALQTVGAAALFPLFAVAVRGKFLSGKPILQPLLFAALWAVREWIQASIGWAGVPWARLPLGQVGLRLTLQSAAFLGSYFVTFLLIAVSMLIADLLLHPDRARLCGILAGSLLVGNLALGGLRLLTRPAEGNAVQVAAIQGNMSSLEKWSGNSVSAERYETLTRNGTDCHDRPLRRCPRPAEPARTRNRRNPAGRRLYLRDGHRKQPAVQFRRRFPAGRKYVRNSVQQAKARPLRGIRPLPGAGHAAGAAAGRHRDAGKRSAGRRPLRGVRPRGRAGRIPDLL